MPPNRSQEDPEIEYRGEQSASPVDRLQARVQSTQRQLAELRHRQEAVERQKRDLEELSRCQRQLGEVREETTQDLTSCLAAIDRDIQSLEKRVEENAANRNLLAQHLAAIAQIDPTSWTPEEHARQLQCALSIVESARADHRHLAPRLADDEMSGAPYDIALGDNSFLLWLQNGFAFTLPLLVLGILALIALLLKG